MTKSEFNLRFQGAIAEARNLTTKAYRIELPASGDVLLFGTGVSGARLSVEESLDRLYLGEKRFFKVIDVAVVEVHSDKTTFFIRASNHKPCEIHESWNGGEGNAPFKTMLGGLKGHKLVGG